MTVLDKHDATRKPDSVGAAAAFTEVRILDESGETCAPGEIGEICGRGPLLMPGYHGRPDMTAEAMRGNWLHSGDLGYMDEDGFVFLVDRKKDMIISGGANVYPRDIEEVAIPPPARNRSRGLRRARRKMGRNPGRRGNQQRRIIRRRIGGMGERARGRKVSAPQRGRGAGRIPAQCGREDFEAGVAGGVEGQVTRTSPPPSAETDLHVQRVVARLDFGAQIFQSGGCP